MASWKIFMVALLAGMVSVMAVDAEVCVIGLFFWCG
jgi:hypothetical protein